jgi:RNA polymerase sigma-70 factor (ECF subfamily)
MDDPRSRHACARFGQLAMPHRNAAFNLAYWLLGNQDEAEDVVQDAYLRAFRAFSTFKGKEIKPWLLAIVRNVAYTAIEARKRSNNVIMLAEDLKSRREVTALEPACQAPTPEAVAIAEGERNELLAALNQLPLHYRDVVILREMEGLSYSEIADVMDTAVGTVMSRLSRARAELRKILMPTLTGNARDAV